MLTLDTLFDGKLTVSQEKGGYRFSLDAILLARLTNVKPCDKVIELGTGSGVVLLILAYLGLGSNLVGLEIQQQLAELAQKNVEANGFSGRIEVMKVDFREASSFFPSSQFDLLLSNPPFRRLGTGRVNPHQQRALARHEFTASVGDIFAAGKYLLAKGGRLAVIYPSARLDHLLVVARECGFNPKELTVVYSARSGSAWLVHLECRKGGGEELKILPPFYIYEENGSYTESMQRMFG